MDKKLIVLTLLVVALVLSACASKPTSVDPGEGTVVVTPVQDESFLRGHIILRGNIVDSGGTIVRPITVSEWEYSTGHDEIQLQNGQDIDLENLELDEEFLIETYANGNGPVKKLVRKEQ